MLSQKLDNIKMIFVDIDGTLYNSKKQITEYTKSILDKLKERGIYVVLCTGRTNSSVWDLSKEINASKYVIGDNGASVYDYKEEKPIFESTLDYKEIKFIWDYCEKNNIEILLNSKGIRYGNSIAVSAENTQKKEIDNIEELSNKKIYQVVLDSATNEQAREIQELLETQDNIWIVNHGNSSVRNVYFFDINNKGIDKGIGINHLIEELGIKREDTICFGDGVNDYAMFKHCGISVAMGNAKEELKKLADYTTLTNNEDGVARFIDKYILNEEE